jgi:hypothetical protein
MSDTRGRTIEKNEDFKPQLEPLLNASGQLLIQKQKSFYLSGIFHIIIFMPIFVILQMDNNGCDEPIREWLITLACVSGFYTITGLLEEIHSYCTKAGNLMAITLGLLYVFQLVWCVIGSVWLFKDPSGCQDDWPSGYFLTLILLILYYIVIGIIMMALCCFCCCVGVFAGAAVSGKLTQPS